MLKLNLSLEVIEEITAALRKSGDHEIGGILMGEHIGQDEFKVTKITVHKLGAISSFIRLIEDALDKLNAFFKQYENNYSQFNYIGEWHSHPLFAPYPSSKDDASMIEIIMDEKVGANFAVLVIVKLVPVQGLIGTAHTYLPSGMKSQSQLVFEES